MKMNKFHIIVLLILTFMIITRTDLPLLHAQIDNEDEDNIEIEDYEIKDGSIENGKELLIIFDCSASMKDKRDNEVKLVTAKNALMIIFDEYIDQKIGMIAYGHRKMNDCSDFELILPIKDVNITEVKDKLTKLKAVGKTPLAMSIRYARNHLDKKRYSILIVISDGAESCRGKPCIEAKKLIDENIVQEIHTIGFSVTDNAKESLECIADAGNGSYTDADDLLTLKTAIKKVIKDDPTMTKIPGGEFMMGSNDGEEDEKEPHKVKVDTFYLDKHEVTNKEFIRFLNEIKSHIQDKKLLIDINDPGCKIYKLGKRYAVIKGYDEHPVVDVSWYGANSYAIWREKRLPTEAEWEYAAGGSGHTEYPLDKKFDIKKYVLLKSSTMKVKSKKPNSFGLYNMGGNVCEWTSTLYKKYPYTTKDGREKPKTTGKRVLRGSSFRDGDVTGYSTRVARRTPAAPGICWDDVGFRCAK